MIWPMGSWGAQGVGGGVHIGVHGPPKEVIKYQKRCNRIKVLEPNKIRGLGRFHYVIETFPKPLLTEPHSGTLTSLRYVPMALFLILFGGSVKQSFIGIIVPHLVEIQACISSCLSSGTRTHHPWPGIGTHINEAQQFPGLLR